MIYSFGEVSDGDDPFDVPEGVGRDGREVVEGLESKEGGRRGGMRDCAFAVEFLRKKHKCDTMRAE